MSSCFLTGDIAWGRANERGAAAVMFTQPAGRPASTSACGGGGVTLSVRPPARASNELSGGEPSRFPPSRALRDPRSGWLSATDVTAHLALHGTSAHAKPLKLSILMAVYNEEKTVTRVIGEILEADYPCEIELIVVDDGSTDATPMLLSQVSDSRVVVLSHPANQGKGAALLSAVSQATGTHILPFDADLEYEPRDIPRVLEPISRGRCDVVYGVRLPGCYTVYQTYLYAAANRQLTRLANILFNAHLTDLHTCLKLIPLATLRSLNLSAKGFGLDSEITAGLLRLGIRPFEVPVSYYGRSHADGKKIKWRDGVACVRILLRERLRARPRQENGDDRPEEDLSRDTILERDSPPVGRTSPKTASVGDEAIEAVTGRFV